MLTFPPRNASDTIHNKAAQSCLRINIEEDPSCLDPRHGRNMAGASQFHAMLFEGLMRYELSGKLTCAQAESYEISEDKLTYTFHLKDVFWSDGSYVTAYDFEKTWKDILDPSFPSLDAHVLFCIKNARSAKKGEVSLDRVGINAKNEKTLIIELDHPSAHFLEITACSVLFPINQSINQHLPKWYMDAGEHFTCNGPFKLSSWKHHSEMVLEKNNHYHRADKIKLDSIHISMIKNGIAVLNIHDSGLFDVIGLPFSPLPFDLARELVQRKLLRIVKMPGTMTCMFNTKQFPFHNMNMRKAFSYAINRQYIVNHVTLLGEDPALCFVPPMTERKKRPSFFKDNDSKEAKSCFQKGLQEIGVTISELQDKISFSFWKHDYGSSTLPQALQLQWLEELGVKVELEALDFKTLHEKGKTGRFCMGYFVFLSMCKDPIELLNRFKYANSSRNYSRWQSEHYIELLDKAERIHSNEKRSALLNQAEKVLMDEMPFTPVFHWNNALLVQPHVKGFAISPLGYLLLDRVSLRKRPFSF